MALRNVSTAALLRLRPLVSRPFSSSPVAKGIPIFTRQSLLDGDAAVKAQLAPLDAVFWKIPSDESLNKTVAALKGLKHHVTVVENKKQALDYLTSLVPDGASIYTASSTSLDEIGFTDYSISNPKWNNIKSKVLALKDPAAAHELRRKEGSTADYFFSSVHAVTEDGILAAADTTGTRLMGFNSSKNLVIVLGVNKIVPTISDAHKRLWDYVVPISGARGKKLSVELRGPNPLAPGHVYVLIVKEKLGF